MASTCAMRTMATDAAKVHASLLLFHLLISKLCSQAILRYTTLPKLHPLAKKVQRVSQVQVKRHRVPLHKLLSIHQIQPKAMERKQAGRGDKTGTKSFMMNIQERERAKKIESLGHNELHIYTDSSGIDGQIGAVVTTRDQKGRRTTLRHHLGSADQHTVYEAELIGIILATTIANKHKWLKKLVILIDN